MRDALKTAGYAGRPRIVIEPARYKAFFEAHIEQGDTLEMGALQIGVVTAIVAIWQYAHHRDSASRTTPAPPRWRAGATRASR